MKIALVALLLAFIVTFCLAIPIIRYLRKKKLGQNILEYVDFHNSKQGTPTMGGLIFLLGLSIVAIIFYNDNSFLMFMTLLVTLGYGLIGFLDDFIKLKFNRNLGLTPIQKIIGQGGLALIVALFCYNSPLVPNAIIVPFSFYEIEIGAWIIPIVFFLYLAVSNAVNLTDGLDGLASSVSAIAILSFGILIFLYSSWLYNYGAGSVIIGELNSLVLISFAFVGCLLAFLMFNTNKAKIFMGDVGSLAIGGFINSVAVFSGLYLYLPFICLMFVITTISVILQVFYYKKTKKRLFLMAPLHHHFEKKGVTENKIVVCYSIISILISVVCIYFTI
ncbi:MAG: phospho-N-acetylmuramoyl-pentapeptide-transferase [Clostridia bacterium]|nr:phospho-N-acetylmuramoyl-pentapeptide-transferase [Clostridia bacterium]